jgi:transposase
MSIWESHTISIRPATQSPLGKAIDYTLRLWDRLTLYLGNGELLIDNNWIENGIRPTAIGKKNWLFVGGETTGQSAAIIYTLVECARRYGHNPEAYLADILERLPAMTNRDDLGVLLPSRWQPATAAGATVEAETAPLAKPATAMAAI